MVIYLYLPLQAGGDSPKSVTASLLYDHEVNMSCSLNNNLLFDGILS